MEKHQVVTLHEELNETLTKFFADRGMVFEKAGLRYDATSISTRVRATVKAKAEVIQQKKERILESPMNIYGIPLNVEDLHYGLAEIGSVVYFRRRALVILESARTRYLIRFLDEPSTKHWKVSFRSLTLTK